MARVSLRIISERTGFSKYAVSRALSGKSGVSSETRSRILQVAEELGYQPPKNQKPETLGAIFNNTATFNSEIHTQFQAGFQAESKYVRYAPKLHWIRDIDETLEFARECSGLVTVNIPHGPCFNALREIGIPIICYGWLEPLDQVDTVGGTDHEAGAAVAKHLVGLGHQEFVYVHGPIDLRGRRERLYGLKETLELVPGTIVHDVVWEEGGSFTDQLNALLSKGARPTAYFCAHDELALTAITDLMARGWRIPDDVSVVGFGDFSAARYVRPPLTTVRTNCEEIGRAAVRLLHARLTEPDWPVAPWSIRIPNSLILRQSTGTVASPHRQIELFSPLSH